MLLFEEDGKPLEYPHRNAERHLEPPTIIPCQTCYRTATIYAYSNPFFAFPPSRSVLGAVWGFVLSLLRERWWLD